MGKASFLAGLALGSTATAALIFYILFPDDHAEDGNEKQHLHQQLLRGRDNGAKTRSALGRNNPETSFLTDIMAELWGHIKIAAADKVQSTVEPYFKDMPAPMNTCRFIKVDLGNVPMTMNNMVVHPIQNDSVQWDFDFEWDGECDIQLQADYVGKFGVKKLKLFGRMAIILKPLTNELPVVSGIQYSFINMPQIDLKFTGLASLAEMKILNDAIKSAIQASMLSSCLPYRRLYKMSPGNNYLDTYVPPVGVLRLTIESGRGFVIEKRLLAKDDVPDVYLNVTLGATAVGSTDVWRTKTIIDDCDPQWNTTNDFLLWDRAQEISIHAWDQDDGPLDPDDDLGVARISVMELLLSPQRRKEVPLLLSGRETGAFVTLSSSLANWTCDFSFASIENRIEANGDLHNFLKATKPRIFAGVLVIVINRAFNLPLDRKMAATFVKAKFAGKEYDSKVVSDYPGYYDGLNPVYDSAFTVPLVVDMMIGDDSKVELLLIDAGQENKCNIVGSTSILLGDLRKHPENTVTEKRKLSTDINNRTTLEFRISLSGVLLPNHQQGIATAFMDSPRSLTPGASSPTKPLPSPREHDLMKISMKETDAVGALGTLRMTVLSGRGLKIEQQLFEVAIPDCYCIVSLGAREFQTTVKHNTIKPIWGEWKDLPLDDHGDIVKLEVWDMNEETIGKGIMMGSATTTVGKLLMAGVSTELEIQKHGRGVGIFISLKCDMVA